MHPAFSVIFLTTLIGAGQGLFLALYTGQLYSVFKVLPVQDSAHFYALGSLLAVLLLLAGLLSSFFHLGHPERAWRSAACWRTSWLSREVIVLPAFTGAVAVYGLIHYLGWNPVLYTFRETFEIDLSLIIGAGASLLGFTLFLCTGMIYACIKQLQEWATPLTVVNYTLLGSASGFLLATAFAAWEGSELTDFFGGWAILMTVVAFITRTASLIRNARIKHKTSLETAIGIRHARIEQKAQGFMCGSFNTREYFHGAPQHIFSLIKWSFLVLVFPVPLVLVSVGLSTHALSLLIAAFLVQYSGLLLERWFFFAQSNHPQNLYYQTVG
ncbi:DMSO reductase anchor subunit [Thiogranum longum]|uniref:DMSO reductase anchor subunit n=1 Tax=Thiogranum longum TaxID=1537524 RepID=A0A4R1HFG4_9GAMM|nr:DmsC/YnfH family molybdoenzyme membrane anchor subunit [Thiogranum longum]TCK19531.1 DMSO reductase anchor subunit [Thiogranum longum]